MTDEELAQLGRGTSHSGFGSRPRPTALRKSWKASELNQFVLSYWLVLFDRHVSDSILKGLRSCKEIADLWSSATLCKYDLDELSDQSVSFFSFFEREFFRYDLSRVGFRELTLRLLLNLPENVESCGLPANYNQF